MKKAISLLLALVICLSLCACGGGKTAESPYEAYAKYEELFMYLETNDYDNANAYIQNFFGISEVEPTETVPVETEPVETEPTFTTVEISLENWQDYFEFKLVASERRNDFDELELFFSEVNLCLKEEWASRVVDMEIPVEYACTGGYNCYFSYNVETKEIIEGERTDGFYVHEEDSGTFTMKKYHIEDGYTLVEGVQGQTFSIENNIASVVGHMFENIEIIRIQGSITIAE